MNSRKSFVFSLIVSFLMTCSGCQKSYNVHGPHTRSLIESAKDYFTREVSNSSSSFQINLDSSTSKDNQNPRKTLSKTPIWESAYTTQMSAGEAVVVPLHFGKPFLIKSNFGGNKLYSIDDITKLLIYKDVDRQFHVEVVTLIPDSSYMNGKGHLFSGIAFVEDWLGHPLNKFKYLPNGKIEQYSTDQNRETASSLKKVESTTIANRSIQICYVISGYNYSIDNPSGGYYWSEYAGCSSYFIDYIAPPPYMVSGYDYWGMGGGGGGGDEYPGINVANAVTVLPGKNVIANFKDYSKCFDNIPGTNHSYQVAVCVSQPEPGTRTTWVFNPVSGGSSSANDVVGVGHTFLTLSETSPSNSIVRNVGFYPTANVDPLSTSSAGALNNDEMHEYNVAVTINLTSSEFNTLLNYISQVGSSKLSYDLNSFNCTTFALNALSNVGINLPRTNGTWPNGSGANPGDLGEDLRKMTLTSKMTRSVSQTPHINKGTCN